MHCWLCYAISLGISFPLFNAVAVEGTRPEHWGVANAMVGFATDSGIGLGVVLWGVLYDAIGFDITLKIVLAFFFVAYIVTATLFPKHVLY